MSCNCLDEFENILEDKDQVEEQDALITIEQLAPYLGVASEDIDDDIIEAIADQSILAVSEQVENFLNRKLKYKQNIVESVSGFGSVDLILKRTPIHKIKCIHHEAFQLNSKDDVAVLNGGLSGVIRFNQKTVNTAALANIYPLSEYKNNTNFPSITVVYSAGYVVEEEQETEEDYCDPFPIIVNNKVSMPKTLVHAICLEVSRIYKAIVGTDVGKFKDPEIRRERLGDYDITFFDPISVNDILNGEKTYGLSRDVIELIRPYRLGVY
jgi:hypothetical protein